MNRSALAASVANALRRSSVTSGFLIHGHWASGVSWTLRAVAGLLRERDAPATIVIAGDTGADEMKVDSIDGVLLIDQAHRLDPAAALVVRDRVLNDGVRVVLGTRSGAELVPPLRWLAAAGAVRTTELPRLDTDEVAALMSEMVGGDVHSGLVHRLTRMTDGRPGFLVDLVATGLDEERIVHRNGLWRQAREFGLAAVRERFGFELSRVDPTCADALAALVRSGPIPVELAPTIGVDRTRILSAGHARTTTTAGRAEIELWPPAVGLLEPDPLDPAVAATARRLLEASARVGVAIRPAQRVRWSLAIGETPPEAEIEAGVREVWQAGDPHTALNLIDQGAGSPSLLRLQADLLAEVGRRSDAIDVLERYEAVAGRVEREAASVERATIAMWLGQRERALAISATGMARGDSSPGAVIGHALLSLEGGDLEAAVNRARPVCTDPMLAGPALVVVATAEALMGRCADAVNTARTALGSFDALGPAPDVATIALGLALGESGDLIEAEQVIADGYRHSLDAGASAQAWMALCQLRIKLYRGDLSAAERYGLEAAELFADLDHHAALRWAVAGRLLTAAAQGQSDLCRELDDRLRDLGESAVLYLEPDVARAHAWARAVTGDLEAARAMLGEAVAIAADAGSLALASTAWHDMVRLDGAAAAVDELGRLASAVDSAWSAPRLAHAEATVAGDPSAALDAALAFHDIGADLCAHEAAADAASIAVRHRDRNFLRSVNATRRSWADCSTARTPSMIREPHADLTERELEVARLAAGGRTNREIAELLGISVRTVENLLHRAYFKLGISRRGELAAAL